MKVSVQPRFGAAYMIMGGCPLKWVDYPQMTQPHEIKDPALDEALAIISSKAKEQYLPVMTIPLRLKKTSDISHFFPGYFLKNAILVLTGTDVLDDETHQRLVNNLNGVEANDAAQRLNLDVYNKTMADAFKQWQRGNSDHLLVQMIHLLLKWKKTPKDKAFLDSLQSNLPVQEKLAQWGALKNEGETLIKTFQEFSKPLLKTLEDKLRGAIPVELVTRRLAQNTFQVKTGGYLPMKETLFTVAHEAEQLASSNT